MNEVINIQIAGQIFHIDKIAFDELKAYLALIKNSLSPYEDKEEIMQDIEVRIAELFLKKLSESKHNLSMADIIEVKKVIGMVDETDSNEESAKIENEDKSRAKLYRIPEQALIAGVCAGLSSKYRIPSFIVRLIFIALIAAIGLGFVLYIILWAILKTPESAAQKIESRGEIPTFNSIVEEFENAQENKPSYKQGFQKVIFFPFFIIGFILNKSYAFLMRNNRIKKLQKFVLTIVLLALAGLFSALIYEFKQEIWMPALQQNIITLVFVFSLSYLLLLALFKVYDTGSNYQNLTKHLNKSLKMILASNALLIIYIFSYFTVTMNEQFVITENFEVPTQSKIIVLNIDEAENSKYMPYIMIQASEDNDSIPRVDVKYRANGRNHEQAEKIASGISYDVEIIDSVISLPSNFKFNDQDDYYRYQDVDVTITIPNGYFLKMKDRPNRMFYGNYFSLNRFYFSVEGKNYVQDKSYYVENNSIYNVSSKNQHKLSFEETRSFVRTTMKMLFSRSHYDYYTFNDSDESVKKKLIEKAGLDKNLFTDLVYILNQSRTDSYTIKLENIENFMSKLNDLNSEMINVKDYAAYVERLIGTKRMIKQFLENQNNLAAN